MKNLLILLLCISIGYACKKNNPQPQPNNLIVNNCDTINCMGANNQGYFIFTPGNNEDTVITGGIINIRYQYADSGYFYVGAPKQQLIHYITLQNNFNISVIDPSYLTFIKPMYLGGGRWIKTKTGKGMYFAFLHH